MIEIITFLIFFLNSKAIEPEPEIIPEPLPDIPREIYVGEFKTSGYYAPVEGQSRYYDKTYENDKYMNCQNSCLHTANGTYLTPDLAFKVVACPGKIEIDGELQSLPLGTQLRIEGLGIVTCHDRGGAIKGRRIDVWNGIGETGFDNIWRGKFPDRNYKTWIIIHSE